MWINTIEFSPVATGKEVCNAHPLSIEHREWVKQELRRIKYGYDVGGQHITGDMYFFLNYYKVFDKTKKTYEHPKFLDFQAEFCKELERARKEYKGIVCVKRRQAGMSELMACVIIRELWFNQAPQIVMLADGDPQLKPLKKNTSNFINVLNQGVFAKNLAVNTPDYKRLGYKTQGSDVWKGQSGELLTRNFTKGQHEVTVGLTPTMMVYDEAGKATGLIDAYEASRPAITDSMTEIMTGLPIVFGAVGDMERAQDLKKMFYEPHTYNMLSYLYEGERQETGFFIEGWRMINTDKDGNSIKEEGTKVIMEKREKAKSKQDERALLYTISYNPLTPAEAFLDKGVNIFNSLKIKEQIDRLATSDIYSKLTFGEIEHIGGKWQFFPTNTWEQVTTTAGKTKDKEVENIKKGRFLIYEEPELVNGKIPDNMYIIGADPIHLEKGTSMGAIYVHKRMVEGGKTLADIPVAEYLYRPSNPALFAEDVLKLCMYYNAVAMVEPTTYVVKDFFSTKNQTHRLAHTPRIVFNNLSRGSQVKYGFPINVGTKSYGIGVVAKYVDDNIENIFFPRLLKELLDYDSDGNFDLVMAFLQVLVYRADLWDWKSKKKVVKRMDFSIITNWLNE